MSNQFRYNQQEGRIWQDIPKPEVVHFEDPKETRLQYRSKMDDWNTRPSYPVSPELKKVWEDGSLKIEEVDFKIGCTSNFYVGQDCKKEVLCYPSCSRTAIPIPAVEKEDTDKLRGIQDSFKKFTLAEALEIFHEGFRQAMEDESPDRQTYFLTRFNITL